MTANTSWNIFNFRLGIIHTLLDAGHRVTVLAPFDDTAHALKHIGCEFVEFPMDPKGFSPFDGLKQIFQFSREYSRLSPDAVFSYTIKNNIFGALAARYKPLKFIPNVTGLGTAFLSGNILQAIVKILYKTSFAGLNYIFFQNEDDKDLFLKNNLINEHQAYCLPGSGIDLQKFTFADMPDNGSSMRFLMISRLLRDKGLYEYVEAARIVKAKYPKIDFFILGPLASGNRTNVGSDILQGWEKEGVIKHLGETKNVRPFITNADCVVLPSYREGAPRSLIEAAAIGRPVITTDVPGCRSVIAPNKSGFLCKAKDGVSLANAIIKFIELSHEERIEMGTAGRQLMEDSFDQSIISRNYMRALMSD